MPEIFQPTVVIEGRAPLPNQLVTRQTYLPTELAKEGVQAFFVNAGDNEAYDEQGKLRGLNIEAGQYAWRLRDVTWQDGDPTAFVESHGYNSALARAELATREGFAITLRELGLEQYGVKTIRHSELQGWEPDEFVFIKPNRISDISQDAGTRARLVRAHELNTAVAESFAGGAVLQRPEQLMPARNLLDQLGVSVEDVSSDANYLHTLRIFTPLWLPVSQTPAVELRLTDPRSDIGKQFATKLKLLEPELVFSRLPELAKLHGIVRNAFAAKYSENNYLTFDYIVCDDGSVKIANGLVRALTPNLEGQAPEVQHLANATADVEVERLAKLAINLAARY